MSTYQGWSNYETWNCSLWLNNDYGLYSYKQELISQARKSKDPLSSLAGALKQVIKDSQPELKGLYSDLLQHGINAINFDEIAKNELDGLED